MDKLQKAREEINEIDAQMAELFCKRMKASKEVAQYKKENGLPVFDAKREQQVIDKNCTLVEDEVLKSYYISYLKNLMKLSKNYQHLLLEGMKVAYSGVPGAFGYIAARKIFPDGNPVSYSDFASAYAAVESGECDCAVLPIENSFAGDVTQVMDLMFFGSLHVSGIYDLEIVQNLVGNKDASIADIKKVISHGQALSQCADYIKLHGFESEEVSNTAVAAKLVKAANRNDVAAISSTDCAQYYGLSILNDKIANSDSNFTRFICISKELEIYPGADRISIIMDLPHTPGSLNSIISKFAVAGLNLTKLESRPIAGRDFEFSFYFDLEASIYAEETISILDALASGTNNFIFLGSYLQA